jgi:hypothetical protein
MTDTATPASPRIRTKTPPAATPAPPPAATGLATGATKSATVIKLLLRAKGATPVELIAATDWQPHSVRAFLSGLRKKGRVLARNERKGGGFAYHMEAALTPPTALADLPPPAAADAASAGDAA